MRQLKPIRESCFHSLNHQKTSLSQLIKTISHWKIPFMSSALKIGGIARFHQYSKAAACSMICSSTKLRRRSLPLFWWSHQKRNEEISHRLRSIGNSKMTQIAHSVSPWYSNLKSNNLIWPLWSRRWQTMSHLIYHLN